VTRRGGRRSTSRGRTLRIGITGPIGCGKSTIARWLGELGARVVDADVVAREVTAPGEPALAAVLDHFGDRYRLPDGSLDRAALGRLVFSDPEALADLESIVHPAVRAGIRLAVRDAETAAAPAVVIEAIKLVEGGLAAECDEVWLVTCDPATQRERLVGRGSTLVEAAERISAQANPAERLRRAATRILDTSGGIAEVRRLTAEAWTAALGG
jgi:dephospho-CoA kinase